MLLPFHVLPKYHPDGIEQLPFGFAVVDGAVESEKLNQHYQR
jgi:hypothetical protein